MAAKQKSRIRMRIVPTGFFNGGFKAPCHINSINADRVAYFASNNSVDVIRPRFPSVFTAKNQNLHNHTIFLVHLYIKAVSSSARLPTIDAGCCNTPRSIHTQPSTTQEPSSASVDLPSTVRASMGKEGLPYRVSRVS